MKLSKLKPNPSNPRIIKDDKFMKLVHSIETFDIMLSIRPIVIDENNVILGGNMRYKAMQHLKLKDIPDEWVKVVKGLTDEQKKEFIVKDNVGFGEWDWNMLANEWDESKLSEWGLDVPQFATQDYSDKNEEIDIDSMDSEMIIKLKYTEEEYWKVKEQLSQIAATPEQAIWKLLGNE